MIHHLQYACNFNMDFCELSYLMPTFELLLLLLFCPPAHLSIILLRLLSSSSKAAKFAIKTNLWLHSRLLLVNVFLDIASSVRVNVENASVELFYKKNPYWVERLLLITYIYQFY